MMPNELKRFETLRARAALGEVRLSHLDSDHGQPVFIVSRWALTQELESLDAVEVWLDRVIGPMQISGVAA